MGLKICAAILVVGLVSCSAKHGNSALHVVGGVTTSIAQYPFMVGLAEKKGDDFEYLCGASQIEPGVILTAGHCFEGVNIKKDGYLVFNLQRLEDLEDSYKLKHSADVLVVKISASFRHEDYNYFDLKAPDLALVFYEIEQVPLPVSQAVIPMADYQSDLAVENELATFIGHGEADPVTGQYAKQLQRASFPRVDLKTCRSYSAKGYAELNDEFLCYGYPEKGEIDFCFGDSGGPLFFEDPSSGPLLLGIANWGSDPCALPDEPGVYTRVAAHRSWIHKKIALHQNH